MVYSYIIKSTDEFWLSTREEVTAFHKQILADAVEQGYSVDGFAYKEHPIKESGEIVDSYFTVKVTKLFDDAKEPVGVPLESITYNHKTVDETL